MSGHDRHIEGEGEAVRDWGSHMVSPQYGDEDYAGK